MFTEYSCANAYMIDDPRSESKTTLCNGAITQKKKQGGYLFLVSFSFSLVM